MFLKTEEGRFFLLAGQAIYPASITAMITLWKEFFDNRSISGYRYDMETCSSLQRNWKGAWITVCLSHLNAVLIPCSSASADSFPWVKEGRKHTLRLRHWLQLNTVCQWIVWVLLMPPRALWHNCFVFSWVQVYTNSSVWTQEVPSGRISRNSWKLLSSAVLKVATKDYHHLTSSALFLGSRMVARLFNSLWHIKVGFCLLVPSLSVFRSILRLRKYSQALQKLTGMEKPIGCCDAGGVCPASCTLSWYNEGTGIGL